MTPEKFEALRQLCDDLKSGRLSLNEALKAGRALVGPDTKYLQSLHAIDDDEK